MGSRLVLLVNKVRENMGRIAAGVRPSIPYVPWNIFKQTKKKEMPNDVNLWMLSVLAVSCNAVYFNHLHMKLSM